MCVLRFNSLASVRARGGSFMYNFTQAQTQTRLMLEKKIMHSVGNKSVTITRPHAIVRKGQVGLGGMYTRSQEKKYRMVYDKRRILSDGINTVPPWDGLTVMTS